MQQFRLLIGQILQAGAGELQRLWDQAADIYLQILEHKGSFLANIANLDFLSSDAFPELKNRPLEML